jgi:hypothetical protein
MHQTKNRLMVYVNLGDDYWYFDRYECSRCDAYERNVQLPKGWGEDFRGRLLCPDCRFPLLDETDDVPPAKLPNGCTCQVIHDGVTFFNCRSVDPNCPIHVPKPPEQRATLWGCLVAWWNMR